jgi:antitoxin CcdA
MLRRMVVNGTIHSNIRRAIQVESVLQSSARKTTNITVDAALLAQARALKINVSQASEAGLRQAVAAAAADRWMAANAAALDSSNAYVESHGLPLARFRKF